MYMSYIGHDRTASKYILVAIFSSGVSIYVIVAPGQGWIKNSMKCYTIIYVVAVEYILDSKHKLFKNVLI